MKTVYTHFSNHFDLIWRRCWDRDYVYHGGRYASYRRIEELCLLRNIELAEQGEGAYVVEQALTLRAFLETHPEALPRLQALYAQGLFEMCGAGEAIIDVNLCSFETLCRNMASGVRYCRDVLGMPPLLANHGDGFGSSAQFPQVIRQCGLPGINGLSYSLPDNIYWRGLDGSTVLVWWGVPGRGYFYDHCYHEPCRACRNLAAGGCAVCRGTGLDLPQNFYPPFEPVPADKFVDEAAQYSVCSEEMLPPEGFSENLRRWEAESPGVTYRWGTPRLLAHRWQPLAAAVEQPPAAKLASRVENNPVQTGCYVSRIRIKLEARRCEAQLYGWETALALTCPQAMDGDAWERLFLELPLYFFHDAVTGTHQDEAYVELMDRMQALQHRIPDEAAQTLARAGVGTEPATAEAGRTLHVFTSAIHGQPLRVPLVARPWREADELVAVAGDGRRFPVLRDLRSDSPAMPRVASRLVDAVGPTARTRPDLTRVYIEAEALEPLAWTELRLERAGAPRPLAGHELVNERLRVELGEHGVTRVCDLQSGAVAVADTAFQLGELQLEEDEGDPWGTRKRSAFRCGLSAFTRFLGAMAGDGYQEAYYAGRFEPNLRFGHEQDPRVFALDWYVTVRLSANARRVDFLYELYWKSADRRLRAVFPVQAETDAGWYSIPGGWIDRARYEQTETCLWSPNGDWPALHHVAARPLPRNEAGWSVVNYGTPSCRIEDGRIMVSLLRSPAFGHCLERYAQNYPMPTSGLRDGGWHHFTLSLLPHAGEADMARLAAEASALNSAPPAVAVAAGCRLPSVCAGIEGHAVELVAAKRGFGGAPEPVLRLLNLSDQPTQCAVTGPAGKPAAITVDRLTEDCPGPVLEDGRLGFRPFEVKTLKICSGRQDAKNSR